MIFVKEMGFSQVIVESDGSRVITCLRNLQYDLSYFGLILEDCLKLRNSFEVVSFSHVN